MNSKPLVSICIPTYNSEKWIKSTIQSAINQTWMNKEIIIVDDGSTDNTYHIAKGFESKSLKVITQENRGACAARNKARSLANGDFIQWLDSDDLLAPDKIEIQLDGSDHSARSTTLHSSAFGLFHYRLKSAKFISNSLWKDLSALDWLLEHYNHGHWMYPAVWLVSRNLTDSAGFWDERLSRNQDGEYFSRVVAASKQVQFHAKAKSFYRKANFSSIASNSASNALQSIVLSKILQVETLLKLENTERTRKACIHCLQREMFRYDLDKNSIKLVEEKIAELGGTITVPPNTTKFEIAKKIFGYKSARRIKGRLWYLTKLTMKFWEKICSVLLRDGI